MSTFAPWMSTRAVAVALLVAGALLARAGETPARVVLSSTVTWIDSAGKVGEALFQGVADGTVLRGMIEAGGTRLAVTGTVDAQGDVAGTVASASGQVGTFSGTLRDGQVSGRFTVSGGSAATWSAPSTGEITAEALGPRFGRETRSEPSPAEHAAHVGAAGPQSDTKKSSRWCDVALHLVA
jgi:hypothetical protein